MARRVMAVGGGSKPRPRAVGVNLDTRKSFLVLFFKKEQRKQSLLF
jgi:hypothetical protein